MSEPDVANTNAHLKSGLRMQQEALRSRVLVAVFCFNENVKIERTLSRFPAKRGYDLIVMNDGSTDDSVKRIRKFHGVSILSHLENKGAGASVRSVHQYAVNKSYDVLVLVAGNDKDDPLLIPRLVNPIIECGYDFVQGSRYLKGGRYGKMPIYRVIASKYIHPLIFSLITRRRITDSTNGFRAYRTSLLKDNRINLDQDWLNKYELEPYFFYKVIKSGYKVKEVPVSKIYPPRDLGYTKMRPILGWWSILKPLLFLGLGLRK